MAGCSPVLAVISKRWGGARCGCFLLLVAIVSQAFSSLVYAEEERIHEVKAAFVLNIARFVSWPELSFAGDDDPVNLCLLEDEALLSATASIADRRVKGRPLAIRTLSEFGLVAGSFCHLFYIGKNNLEAFELAYRPKSGAAILTIVDLTLAENTSSGQLPAVVSLVRKGEGVGLEVNPGLAKSQGLELSSQLLELARIVEPGVAP